MDDKVAKENLVLIVLVTQCFVNVVNAYSGGAPWAICDAMAPSTAFQNGHGALPQTTVSPYSVEILNGVTTYSPNTPVRG